MKRLDLRCLRRCLEDEVDNIMHLARCDHLPMPTLAILDPDPGKQSASYIAGIKKDFDQLGLEPPTVYTRRGCDKFVDEKEKYTSVICVSGGCFKHTLHYKSYVDRRVEGIAPNEPVPCAAAAIFNVIASHYTIPKLVSKNVIIINRSMTVGIPLSYLLTEADCTVTVMHMQTPLETKRLMCSMADIIVTATGWPDSFDLYMLSTCKDQLVVDIGMGLDRNKKFHTDMSDKCIEMTGDNVSYVTYKDVGPITRINLIKNMYMCLLKQLGYIDM